MATTETILLERFLRVAACPKCGAKLRAFEEGVLSCAADPGHRFETNDQGFFEFAQKTEQDKYDDKELIGRYIGYAYGYRLVKAFDSEVFVGVGEAEGLYRCIIELILSSMVEADLLAKQQTARVLELGCGVGRCIASTARYLPDALFVGFDYSASMIEHSADILLGTGMCEVDLEAYGFGTCSMPCYALENAFLAQADARNLPLQASRSGESPGFDIVVCNMLVDRIKSEAGVVECLRQSVSVLKEGGVLIVSTPMNWISRETWNSYGDSRTAVIHLLQQRGMIIDEAFDGLVYRERMDPHGTHLELPVQVVRAHLG